MAKPKLPEKPKSKAVAAQDTRRERQRATQVLGLGILLVLTSFIGIRHFNANRSYNSRVIAAAETSRDQAQANLQAIESLQKDLSQLEDGKYTSVDVLDALPSKYDHASILVSIDKLVLQNGLILSSLTHSDISDSAPEEMAIPSPLELSVDFSVTGNYEEIQKLVGQIENTTRPIQILELAVSGEGQEMVASFKTVTYYQPSESDTEIITKEIQ